MPPFRVDPEVIKTKLVLLDTSALFADAIQRLHAGGSIVELLES
jgi:ribose-phosphate pyrophosphokinase